MDQNYDSNEYMDSSQRNYSEATTPASVARGHFGDTSSFSTTGISDDGRFLGIKLSSELASQARTIYPVFLDWARRKGEKYSIPLAKKFAEKALSYTGQDAHKFSTRAGDVVGYGVIFSQQLLDIGRNVYDSAHSVGDLRRAVRPLSELPGTSALSGNNEVVANARSKINGVFWLRLTHTLTGAIATAPALMIKLGEQKKSNVVRANKLEIESAQTPEEVAALYKKKITGGSSVGVNISEENAREGLHLYLEGERDQYVKRMQGFIAEHEGKVKGEIEVALNGITHENVRSKVRELDQMGVDTRVLESAMEKRWNREHQRHERPSVEEIAETIAEFKDEVTQSLGHYANETLKTRFVRRYGAFDDEYTDYLNKNERRQETIRDQLIEKIESWNKTPDAEDKHSKDDPDGMGKMLASFGAGLGAEMATKALGGTRLEKYRQPIALDRILHLRRELEIAGDNPPPEVPGIPNGKSNERDEGYTRYVHQIFQQHQKDCHRNEVGTRFFEHFENANWEDDAIQRLRDEELSVYEVAVKTIAKRIKDGRMDAIALVGLVGDKQNKIVREDGRSFGPRGSGNNDDQQKTAILHIIDEQTVLLHSGLNQAKQEEVHEKLGNFVFTVEELKSALTAGNLEASERSFIFTVFSNVVGNDEKLCEMVGITLDECKALRAESKDKLNQLMDGAVNVLADMIEKQPDELAKHLKLTDKEKELIRSLAGRMHDEKKDAADLADNREQIKSLETVVANAAFALHDKQVDGEGDKKQNFWQRLVSAAKKPSEILSGSERASSAQERETQRRETTTDQDADLARK